MLAILCLFGKHRLNRNKVWHDGLDYRSRCTRCDAALIRDSHSDRWRPYAPKRDDTPERMHKPGR